MLIQYPEGSSFLRFLVILVLLYRGSEKADAAAKDRSSLNLMLWLANLVVQNDARTLKITETLAPIRALSEMVFKDLCILVIWTKVALSLEGYIELHLLQFLTVISEIASFIFKG